MAKLAYILIMKPTLYATLLVTLLTIVHVQGAVKAIDGEMFVAAGTTGTNAIPTSRTTNVTINATSRVVDGASAIAFSLNSSNALSTSGAKLLTVDNKGTNTLVLSIISGGNNMGLLSDGATYADIYAQSPNASVYCELYADNVHPSIGIFQGSDYSFIARPGEAIYPYVFNTAVTVASTNVLANFANNGTNKVLINSLGTITLYGTTNQLVFGSTNTAPSSSVAPTKWISVQVQGESTAYRLPLYQ